MATGTIGAVKASSVSFFYGRITRDEAEIILRERGAVEGQYLLRESINPLGNYAISICHNNNVHHYNIEKQADGMYMIQDGKKFVGPVELIEHHSQFVDGFITQPVVPCNRLPFQAPVAFRGMTFTDLEYELKKKAETIRGVNMEIALGPQREHLMKKVAKDLHLKQPWYHAKISRDEADKRLTKEGHKDGKYLVRQRDDKKTFALSVSFRNECRHYMVDRHGSKDEKYSIQDGPRFDCLMMLVDHYHNKQDGLLCKLSVPCAAPGFDKTRLKKFMESCCDNLAYLKIGVLPSPPVAVPHPGSLSRGNSQSSQNSFDSPGVARPRLQSQQRKLPPTPDERGPPDYPAPVPPRPNNPNNLIAGDWEAGHQTAVRRDLRETLTIPAEELEETYGRLPRRDLFNLTERQINLEEDLGAGQFGAVKKGTCDVHGQKIPVAIKTLKNEDVQQGQEPELIKEAKVMQDLSHKNIVRMIGLCKATSIMLVMELAPLGPLNSYLTKHKDIPQWNIVELMAQVANGMAYLESKHFVHRDLAARNVLLVHEHFAKISDFGMSKALNRGNNYYEAREAGKWPLKWYAPECVYYWKFDSRSDVWSYGVTLWEATSYADRPYRKMKGQQIIQFIVEENKRLACPPMCDQEVYDVMLECWKYDKNQRPTFEQLSVKMDVLFNKLKADWH